MNPLHYGVADTFGLVGATSCACFSVLRTTLARRTRHRLFEKLVEKRHVADHGGYPFSVDELLANIPRLGCN